MIDSHRRSWMPGQVRHDNPHPQRIVCDISGYGGDGPYCDKKAYDLLIQAGSSIADIAAGMYAYSGIMAALLQRHRTGEGSHIDVSMLDRSPSG